MVTLIRLPVVRDMTSLSTSTIYSWMSTGKFPAPIRLSPRAVAWPVDVIEKWVAERAADKAV